MSVLGVHKMHPFHRDYLVRGTYYINQRQTCILDPKILALSDLKPLDFKVSVVLTCCWCFPFVSSNTKVSSPNNMHQAMFIYYEPPAGKKWAQKELWDVRGSEGTWEYGKPYCLLSYLCLLFVWFPLCFLFCLYFFINFILYRRHCSSRGFLGILVFVYAFLKIYWWFLGIHYKLIFDTGFNFSVMPEKWILYVNLLLRVT